MGNISGTTLEPLDGENTFSISQTFEFLLARTAKLEKEISEFKDVSKLKGDTGPQGPPGSKGPKGETGNTGMSGLNGKDGKDGITTVIHAWQEPPSIWHLTKKRMGF